MKTIFVAGSRKYFTEMEDWMETFSNVKIWSAGKWDSSIKDNLENQKKALLRAFQRIEESEILYVYCPNGYAGRTVCMEISYAYAKNKKIISSEKLEELSAQGLVNEVLSPEEFKKRED